MRPESEGSGETKKYLLDTSALLTLMEDEAGADEVEDIIRNSEGVIIPFIVLLELYYITLREKGEEIANRRFVLLKSLDAEYLTTVDEPIFAPCRKIQGCVPSVPG